MPHPRARRLMRRQIGAEVLVQKGITNVANGDATNPTVIANLQNLALYSQFGISPVFSAGSTTRLSDAVSNSDGVWTLAGLTGETTNLGAFLTSSMSGAVGIFVNSKHYMIPSPIANVTTDLSSSAVAGPFILYSADGPKASSATYYIESDANRSVVLFDRIATGSGTPTHLSVYIGGELASGESISITDMAGTVLNSRTSLNNFATIVTTSTTCSSTELSANNYRKAFIIGTGSLTGGFKIFHNAPSTVTNTTTKGFFIAIGSGSYT